MAFTDYKNLTILKAKHPQIVVNSKDLIPELLEIEVEASLKKDIKNNLEAYRSNEFYACENLVSPILRYVWHNMYFKDINMWTHQAIKYDDDLCGVPDFMFTPLDQGKSYNTVRINLFCEGKALFQQPMLLLTNKKIINGEQAKAIYKGYILRFKIEVVFKFLKQNLGWESFQVRAFETIKNLLAIAFFLIDYFNELEEELKTHPLALLLCKLGISKGKVTIFYLLQGLAKLVHFQKVELWKIENNISNEDISEFMAKFKNQN